MQVRIHLGAAFQNRLNRSSYEVRQQLQREEQWWLGVRDVEKEKYERTGGDFENDESDFRCGFEAALHPGNRDQSYEICRDKLRDRYPNNHESDAFRRGYERGGAYLAALKNRRN